MGCFHCCWHKHFWERPACEWADCCSPPTHVYITTPLSVSSDAVRIGKFWNSSCRQNHRRSPIPGCFHSTPFHLMTTPHFLCVCLFVRRSVSSPWQTNSTKSKIQSTTNLGFSSELQSSAAVQELLKHIVQCVLCYRFSEIWQLSNRPEKR